MNYILVKYKKKGSYDILEDISVNFTLVQLMDSLGNVNHDISVVGYWIFTQTTREHLYLIDNRWIRFVPHILVKNKMLSLKQYFLQLDTFAFMRD